ncbi:MAG TPA: protein kinase [Vicinamibacterales bacterium]|nr:protein kinase [Vicinamibacterales bacterium]
MTLTTGTHIGTYEVLGTLGAGGMGEVYRARDTKLHRDVAIKILPELFAADPERVARFEREAQTLASLNHPHIAHVYGVVEHPLGLVMELVEGEDLAQRLAGGPLQVQDAIPIARQIAEALEAAHERGIVHRDLKPANIRVTPDGVVKVLDFGLAKAVENAAGVPGDTAALANSPTFTSPVGQTRAGVILGTAAYMAPEQARGKAVDKRADVWAFGCVLYEMLTGRRAFDRAEVTDTLAAILRDAPDLAMVPPGTPAELRRLIDRCLEKDPKDRLRDIGEARIALARIGDAPAVARDAPAKRGDRWVARLAWIAAGLVLGGAAASWLAPRRPAGPPLVASLRQLTQMPGAEINPDISPDGRQIIYAAGPRGHRDLYLLRVGGGRAIDLTSSFDGDDVQGAFSPDGQSIAFRSERDAGGLFVMGATGESVRRLTSAGFDPRWSPDATRLAYATEGVDDPYSRAVRSQLWIVSVGSGQAKKLLDGDAVQPSWSPHGTRIAFWANSNGQRDIETVASSGGPPRPVTHDAATDWAPEWSPDGRWLYFVSDRSGSPNLWRVAIDESTGATRGSPQAVTNGVRAIASGRFSQDGSRMVIGVTDRSFELSFSAFDPSRPDTPAPVRSIRSASLGWCMPSHDASWLACTSRTGQEDIVLLRADGGETRRLTDDAFKDRLPFWSPDDKRVSFMSTRSGGWEVWAIGVDGSGLRQLTSRLGQTDWGVWSPDGRHMAVGASTTPPYGVWFLDASKTATRENASQTLSPVRSEVDSWSTDGALLAGTETDAGGNPAAVMVWDVVARRLLRRITLPLVRVSSSDITFVAGTHDLIANARDGIAIVDADTGRWRIIRKLAAPFEARLSGDGHTLLVESPGVDADLWLMEFAKAAGS